MAFFLEEIQVFFDELLPCNHQFNRTLSFKKIYQITPEACQAFFVSRLVGILCLLNDILALLLCALLLYGLFLRFLAFSVLEADFAASLCLSLSPSFFRRFCL